jgi:primosomal protein N'
LIILGFICRSVQRRSHMECHRCGAKIKSYGLCYGCNKILDAEMKPKIEMTAQEQLELNRLPYEQFLKDMIIKCEKLLFNLKNDQEVLTGTGLIMYNHTVEMLNTYTRLLKKFNSEQISSPSS